MKQAGDKEFVVGEGEGEELRNGEGTIIIQLIQIIFLSTTYLAMLCAWW